MPTRRFVMTFLCGLAALASAGTPVASAATDCGVADRPYTDGGAEVTVQKGSLRCATARGVMQRYWKSRVDAFKRTVRLRHGGIRWTCRPTTDDFPYRWACTGGGPERNRFRITARE